MIDQHIPGNLPWLLFCLFVLLHLFLIVVPPTCAAGHTETCITEFAFCFLIPYTKTCSTAAQLGSSSFSESPVKNTKPSTRQCQPAWQLFLHCIPLHNHFPDVYKKCRNHESLVCLLCLWNGPLGEKMVYVYFASTLREYVTIPWMLTLLPFNWKFPCSIVS